MIDQNKGETALEKKRRENREEEERIAAKKAADGAPVVLKAIEDVVAEKVIGCSTTFIDGKCVQTNKTTPIRSIDDTVKERHEELAKVANDIDVNKSKSIDKFRLSYIEDYEEEEAKRLIEESLGFEPIRVTGWQVAVKVYTRPEDVKEIITDEGKKISIYLPNEARAHDKFVNCVGLVINMGQDCYKDKYFVDPLWMRLLRKVFGKWMKSSTKVPWCKIGDWVVFDRNAGPQINYRDVPVTILEDKHIRAVVQCPTHVSRY